MQWACQLYGHEAKRRYSLANPAGSPPLALVASPFFSWKARLALQRCWPYTENLFCSKRAGLPANAAMELSRLEEDFAQEVRSPLNTITLHSLLV